MSEMMAPSSHSNKTILVSAEKVAKFSQYPRFLEEYSSVNTFVESDKICLITNTNKWVIDSGATNHMTGNPNIFSSFLSHKSSFPVTVAMDQLVIVLDLGLLNQLYLLPCYLY